MMETNSQLVHPAERVDLFLDGKLAIIQSPDYFTLSVDAILLANFINLPHRSDFKYLDFCSGNGVIPLLLSQRTDSPLSGIEIQAPLVEMARRSAQYNHLDEQLNFIHGDIKVINRAEHGLYEVISCNPPYFRLEDSNYTHKINSHAIARHEITLTLEDWISKAAQIMRDKGRLFFVHRPNRLDDIMEMLLKYHFAVHRIKFVYPKANVNANAVLVEAIYRGGRQGVKIEPPIVVHRLEGGYTQEMQAIYQYG